MKKWNLIIDVALCHDCNNCFLADKDEFVGNDFPPYSAAQPWAGQRWMNIERKERGQYPIVQVAYLPMPCMHCDDAPCIKDSPAGTIYKREDGLIIIDPVKAKGHPEIVDTCPYGAIYWNEEAQLAQKCTGCAHLIDRDPLLAGLPHRRHQAAPGRRRGSGCACRSRRPRGLQG
jgi:Fe-S-cluster-containing dehydrogenase component